MSRRSGIRFADKDMRQQLILRRFSLIWDHLAIPYQRKTPQGAGIRAVLPPKTLTFGGSTLVCPANAGQSFGRRRIPYIEVLNMAKAVTIKVKLVSTADTGFYYVAKKNSRTMTDKLVKKKYDPVARKHVEFKEAKIK